MIAGKRVLALIPARGGSKGLPGKNTREFAGKPLVAWTIDAARSSQYVDAVILSSDDDQIIAVAKAFGCAVPFKRAPHLATDTATSADVIIDALGRCPGYDIVVLLQPTSPLRFAQDIDAALELFISSNMSACVSVCEAQESPYWMFTMSDQSSLVPLIAGAAKRRRQDLPPCYSLNGAIYIAEARWFASTCDFMSERTAAYLMPVTRSIDIDTMADFEMAELAFKQEQVKTRL